MDQKRLKVAFLSRYVGHVNRGVESFVQELAKKLETDFEIEILTGQDADSFRKIITGNYDIVIPTNGRMQALKASVARLFSKHKLIISGHSGVGRDDLWNILVARPDVFVALTDFEMQWAKKWFDNKKIVKIPNGIDMKKFNPEGADIALDIKQPIILSVGALYWYKRHELTIKAVEKLKKGSLVIIGSGPEQKKLEQLGEKLLSENRLKILQADYQQMPNYYRSAKLFVLPSWDREAFGIVYLEAMAANLPVVAPNDQTRREIIGDGGILVDVSDIEAYASAIEQCLNNSWGQKPREQAAKFSWDNVAQQYTKLFEELL